MELNEIKSKRKLEIDTLAVSPVKRKLKKIRYLLKYGIPFNKFIKYALSYAFILPLAKIKTNLRNNAIRERYFGNNSDTCYIAVNIGNAGMGDAIVAIRFIRDIADLFTEMKDGSSGNKVVFDIFYRSPSSIKFIISPQPHIKRILNLFSHAYLYKFYDIDLRLNTFFLKEKINESSLEKLSEKFPTLLKIIKNIKVNQTPLEKYIKTRPFSENILSNAVTAMGLSRMSYLNRIAEIPYNSSNGKDNTDKGNRPDVRLNIAMDSAVTARFNLNGIKFITIHDGWDENTKTAGRISTKSYPPEKWTELVSSLKREIPNYMIVQLGGLGNGSDIENVDLNLRGETTLKEVASILSETSLHIDTDSGLVHIASCLGTHCAVLFGPTNAAYCSYSENLNITSHSCSNCWWSTDNWMSACPKGLAVPECMNSMEPANIVKRIKSKLEINKNIQ